MEEYTERSGWAADVARVLTGAAGWVSLASFVSPWSREQGAAEVGFSGLAGVRGLGAVDVQGRGTSWLDTVHWVDAWLVLVTAVVLWAAAVAWRRRAMRLVAVGTSGLLLILGAAAIVVHLAMPGEVGAPWYGPYLAIVAGVSGLIGSFLGRRALAVPGTAPSGEMRVRAALVDFDLDRHVTPRLIRRGWALLVTALVGAYLVVAVGTVFDELTTTADPAWVQAISAVAAVALASLALGVVLLVLRVIVEFLVVPFRIVDAMRPSVPAPAIPQAAPVAEPEPATSPEPRTPSASLPEPPSESPVEQPSEPRREPPPTEPTPTPTPAPSDDLWAESDAPPSGAGEPEPWVARERPRAAPPVEDSAQEPEPFAAPVEPRPTVKVHGTEDRWYRREPSDASGQPLPEARGIPEHDDQGHPLRRAAPGPQDGDDPSGGSTTEDGPKGG